MQLWTEHATKQVFQNARPGRHAQNRITLHSARNAYVSAQIVLRDIVPFEIREVRVQGKDTGNIRAFYQEYHMFNDRVAYPDALTQIELGAPCPRTVPAHVAQSIWVDFYVPPRAHKGQSTYRVEIETGAGTEQAEIELRVAGVTLPVCSASTFQMEYFFNIADMPGVAPQDMYSEAWWEVLGQTAACFREMRNSAVGVTLLPLLRAAGSRRTGRDTWQYKWDVFDRYVDLFLESGCAKSFVVRAMIESVQGSKMEALGMEGETISLETPSEEAALFLSSLYKALNEHLHARGLHRIFRTHLEDEPHTSGTWRWARDILRAAAPEIPCSEPLDMLEISKELAGYADLFVPRLDIYEQDPAFFRKRQKKGDEVWVYSCCFPEESWWLNKFIDMPVIRSRLMAWACRANGITGFLHWGFNHWSDTSLYGTGPEARFKGDGNIVYPDPEHHTFRLSARFINTRDGMQDAELLALCAKKAPEETERLTRSICRSFQEFSEDEGKLFRAVERLLEQAEA